QTSRNPQRHLSLFCGADKEKFQMLWWIGAKPCYLPVTHDGLHRVKASLFCHHNVPGRRYTGWQVNRPFAFIMADWLVAVEGQAVGDLPFHIEHSHGTI